jgi:hypothetical protein
MITPLVSKKTIIIAFTFDLLILAFFILGEVGVFQCVDCLFVSGSYRKIHVSSHVMKFSSTSGCSDSFHDVRAKCFPVVFLFLSEIFRDQFCTDLPHVPLCSKGSKRNMNEWIPHVQLIVQDLSYGLFVHINNLSNHSNAQTSIFPNNLIDFLNIFFGFWCWSSSWPIVVFHFLPTFHEPFVPFKNSPAWHYIITVYLP